MLAVRVRRSSTSPSHKARPALLVPLERLVRQEQQALLVLLEPRAIRETQATLVLLVQLALQVQPAQLVPQEPQVLAYQ